MKSKLFDLRGLESFLIFWSTQALSALGSAMTSFALVVWSYQQQGSALTTAAAPLRKADEKEDAPHRRPAGNEVDGDDPVPAAGRRRWAFCRRLPGPPTWRGA